MNKLKEKYIYNISNIVLTDERNDYIKLETINRYKKRKKKNKIINTIIIILIFLVLFIIIFINYYSNKSKDVLMAYAESETRKLTILVINKAITKQMSDSWANDIFDVVYNDKGEIILIDFNSQNTAKILSTMTSLIELNLRAIEEGKIDMLELPNNSLESYDMDLLEKGIITYIPFGIATGSSLLYNLGPKIPVKLSLLGDVITGFSTDVTEYGINNALIKLMIDVKVDTRIILPIISEEITINANIPIAMKVVQGKIPDYYMNGFTSRSNISN